MNISESRADWNQFKQAARILRVREYIIRVDYINKKYTEPSLVYEEYV